MKQTLHKMRNLIPAKITIEANFLEWDHPELDLKDPENAKVARRIWEADPYLDPSDMLELFRLKEFNHDEVANHITYKNVKLFITPFGRNLALYSVARNENSVTSPLRLPRMVLEVSPYQLKLLSKHTTWVELIISLISRDIIFRERIREYEGVDVGIRMEHILNLIDCNQHYTDTIRGMDVMARNRFVFVLCDPKSGNNLGHIHVSSAMVRETLKHYNVNTDLIKDK